MFFPRYVQRRPSLCVSNAANEIFFSVYHSLEGKALGIFSGLNLAAFILVFLLVEETKQRSLEELDYIFEVPKSKFIRFQLLEYLPWWISCYVLGDRYPMPELGEPSGPSPLTGRRPRNIRRESVEIEASLPRTPVSGPVELVHIPNNPIHGMRSSTNDRASAWLG